MSASRSNSPRYSATTIFAHKLLDHHQHNLLLIFATCSYARTPRLVQVAPSPSNPPPIQITPNANGATAMGRIEEGGSSDGEGDS